MALTALKISHLEQLNSQIFAWLSPIFSSIKMEHLIKQIGIILLNKTHIAILYFNFNITQAGTVRKFFVTF